MQCVGEIHKNSNSSPTDIRHDGFKGLLRVCGISIADLSLSLSVRDGWIWTSEVRGKREELVFFWPSLAPPGGVIVRQVAMATQSSDVRAPRNVKQSTGEEGRKKKKRKDPNSSLARSLHRYIPHYLRALNPRGEAGTARLSCPRRACQSSRPISLHLKIFFDPSLWKALG